MIPGSRGPANMCTLDHSGLDSGAEQALLSLSDSDKRRGAQHRSSYPM